MLTRNRFTTYEVVRWTRYEITALTLYAATVTALYVLADLRFLHLPWAPLAVVGTAVAFVVGFQNNAAYGRIWEARKIWGAIVNSSRSWGIQVQDLVTNEHASEPVDAAELATHKKTLIHRHLAWLTALRHAMRQPRPWEDNNTRASNREWSEGIHIQEREHSLEDELRRYLSPPECDEVLARTNRPAAILAAQSRHLRQAKERGLIWEFSFLRMHATLESLLESQGKSERIKNFPYPRQYATLGHVCVRLFVLCVPFAALPEFAAVTTKLEDRWPTIGCYFVWLAVPFSLLMSWVFVMIERIGKIGENPFEGTANDVPISTISRGIEIDLLEQLGDEDVPGPLPTPCDVQT